jgi:putative ABC transport system substrate-binding protein
MWIKLLLVLWLSMPVFPRAAGAQQPKKIPRVGYLAAVSASADAPRLEAFRQGLRELGYLEGQNIIVEYRHKSRGFERLPELAAELVGQKPDVLVQLLQMLL